MTTPAYLLEKIARHGAAAVRLKGEVDSEAGEFGGFDSHQAIAFDAADFVWTFLAISGNDDVQQSREVRNKVAESISGILKDLIE